MAAAVVKQVTQLLIVDLQQLHLDVVLTLQQQGTSVTATEADIAFSAGTLLPAV